MARPPPSPAFPRLRKGRLRAGFDRAIWSGTIALWEALGVPVSIPAIDGLIAATAIAYGLTIVTRNIKDMARTGAVLRNPFT